MILCGLLLTLGVEIQDFWRGKQTKQLSAEQIKEQAELIAKGEEDIFEAKDREQREKAVKQDALDKDKDQDVKY